jgi:hypothetical protein
VDEYAPIEDERGVDIVQIRRQLAMSVPERVRTMVEAANTMMQIRDHARASMLEDRR